MTTSSEEPGPAVGNSGGLDLLEQVMEELQRSQVGIKRSHNEIKQERQKHKDELQSQKVRPGRSKCCNGWAHDIPGTKRDLARATRGTSDEDKDA